MSSHSDDSDLVVLFREQDAAATRQLYDRFYRPLCYYAEKMILDKLEAEDIVVESFLKLLHKRSDFHLISDIKAFLYTATRNACIDFLRKQKRHQHSHDEIFYLAEQSTLDQELPFINAEVLAVLYLQIEQLPPQCAQVFKLYFFERLTTDKVALQLGISTKTALNQKGKAVQLLRKAFLEKGLLSLWVTLSALYKLM